MISFYLPADMILVNAPFFVICQDLAFDLSLSALLGDNIYNFGELLAHPIVSIYIIIFGFLSGISSLCLSIQVTIVG